MPLLNLKINSNLGSKFEIVKKFTDQVQALIENRKIASFELFTSMDTWGPRAEYIRYGLDVNTFEKNLFYFLENTQQPVTIMNTFNIYSLSSFRMFLEKILKWRALFPKKANDRDHRVRFDLAYLKEPLQFDMHLLPKEEFLPYMKDNLRFIEENLDDNNTAKFSFMDYQRTKRLVKYLETTPYSQEKINSGRADFHRFFSEMDRRRKTDRYQVFPEMKKFFSLCEQAAGKSQQNGFMNKVSKFTENFISRW